MRQSSHLGLLAVAGFRLACLKKRAVVRQRRQLTPELQALLEKYQAPRAEDPATLVLQWLEARPGAVRQ